MSKSSIHKSVIVGTLLVMLSCQNKRDFQPLVIHLDQFRTDSIPFVPMFNIAMFSHIGATSFLGLDSIRVGKIILQPDQSDSNSHQINDSVNIIFGVQNGRDFAVVESNNNGRLDDENAVDVSNAGFIEVKNVHLQIGDTNYFGSIRMQPGISTVFPQLVHKPEKGIYGVSVLPLFRYGSFKVAEGAVYNVALCNYFQRVYNDKYSFLVLSPPDKDFNADLVRYRIGDTIYLNKNVYVFNKVSKSGDKVELEQIARMDKKFGIQEGDFAFKMTFNNISTGDPYTIGTSEKYTLLDFWGTWCAPCRELTDELKQINDRYHDKIEIVSIAYDDSLENVTNYLAENDIHWPNCFDPQRNSLITSKFNVKTFPTFILLDKEGKIMLRGTSKDALDRVVSLIEKG